MDVAKLNQIVCIKKKSLGQNEEWFAQLDMIKMPGFDSEVIRHQLNIDSSFELVKG